VIESFPETEQPISGIAPGTEQMPRQRWQIFPAQASQAQHLAEATQLSPLLAQVLINRGLYTPEQAWLFLDPETQTLPSPLDEFPDLPLSLELLVVAIEQGQKIAICGDYDADGMTSTALLMRALRYLGANANYAIPSRMQEGYGLNQRIVEEFSSEGVGLILTVDNGISAYEPVARARDLGLTVIITDHHDLPEQLPPAHAILNPKLLPVTSPYRGVAGVGVAYVLAVCLAQALQKTQDLTAPLLELFTLGTIADLAPLTGVNRRWVRRGLKLLPKSRIPGVQALIEVAGLGQEQKALKPEAIGFRLGPRINAVGRIADPQIVIEMLTTEDVETALARAVECEQANTERQGLCEQIEAQAVAWCEAQQQQGKLDLQKERVLVVIQPDWHHGVIGIVASRLVERYGVPVFIGTYEDKKQKEIRGSARGIPEFNVYEALHACHDLLDKYGGHRAAGGFSFPTRNLRQVKTRLRRFASECLQPEYLKPLVTVDVQACFAELDLALYEQIDRLHPCGIENADPVFWTSNVQILDQQIVGKDRKHLKLTLSHTPPETQQNSTIRAIAWRWGDYYPLPPELDVAYKLRLNEWRGERSIELELVGVRLPKARSGIPPWSMAVTVEASNPALNPEFNPVPDAAPDPGPDAEIKSLRARDPLPTATVQRIKPTRSPELPRLDPPRVSVPQPDPALPLSPIPGSQASSCSPSPTGNPRVETIPADCSPAPSVAPPPTYAEFFYSKRRYVSTIESQGTRRELKIQNAEGHLLIVKLAERQGVLQLPGETPLPIDLSETHYFNLLRAGLNALELKQKTKLLIHKDELLVEKDGQIEKLIQQVSLLEDKLTQLSQEKQVQFQSLKTELTRQETAIQDQEAHIVQLQTQIGCQDRPLPDPEAIKHQVRDAVGDTVWFCIQADSQKDLCAAYKNYAMIQAEGADPQIADYSEAGIRLSFTVEREVIQPFFQDLYEFLLVNGGPELGGLSLGPNRQYTLGMMPSLLADQWQTFQPDALKHQAAVSEKALFYQAKASYPMNQRDRNLLTTFLDQWEHPLSGCLTQKGSQMAACLDQISRLRNIAAHGERFLYEWQYNLLYQLIVGEGIQPGLFKQIYGG
jgi:single-stranded-DNA-specific exonuclease